MITGIITGNIIASTGSLSTGTLAMHSPMCSMILRRFGPCSRASIARCRMCDGLRARVRGRGVGS